MAVAYLPKFVLGSNNCFWSRGLKFIVKLDASGPEALWAGGPLEFTPYFIRGGNDISQIIVKKC